MFRFYTRGPENHSSPEKKKLSANKGVGSKIDFTPEPLNKFSIFFADFSEASILFFQIENAHN